MRHHSPRFISSLGRLCIVVFLFSTVVVSSCRPMRSGLSDSNDTNKSREVWQAMMHLKTVQQIPGEFWAMHMIGSQSGVDQEKLQQSFLLQASFEKLIRAIFDANGEPALALEASVLVWELLHEANLPEESCIRMNHDAASLLGRAAHGCEPSSTARGGPYDPSVHANKKGLRPAMFMRIAALAEQLCKGFSSCVFGMDRLVQVFAMGQVPPELADGFTRWIQSLMEASVAEVEEGFLREHYRRYFVPLSSIVGRFLLATNWKDSRTFGQDFGMPAAIHAQLIRETDALITKLHTETMSSDLDFWSFPDPRYFMELQHQAFPLESRDIGPKTEFDGDLLVMQTLQAETVDLSMRWLRQLLKMRFLLDRYKTYRTDSNVYEKETPEPFYSCLVQRARVYADHMRTKKSLAGLSFRAKELNGACAPYHLPPEWALSIISGVEFSAREIMLPYRGSLKDAVKELSAMIQRKPIIDGESNYTGGLASDPLVKIAWNLTTQINAYEKGDASGNGGLPGMLKELGVSQRLVEREKEIRKFFPDVDSLTQIVQKNLENAKEQQWIGLRYRHAMIKGDEGFKEDLGTEVKNIEDRFNQAGKSSELKQQYSRQEMEQARKYLGAFHGDTFIPPLEMQCVAHLVDPSHAANMFVDASHSDMSITQYTGCWKFWKGLSVSNDGTYDLGQLCRVERFADLEARLKQRLGTIEEFRQCAGSQDAFAQGLISFAMMPMIAPVSMQLGTAAFGRILALRTAASADRLKNMMGLGFPALFKERAGVAFGHLYNTHPYRALGLGMRIVGSKLGVHFAKGVLDGAFFTAMHKTAMLPMGGVLWHEDKNLTQNATLLVSEILQTSVYMTMGPVFDAVARYGLVRTMAQNHHLTLQTRTGNFGVWSPTTAFLGTMVAEDALALPADLAITAVMTRLPTWLGAQAKHEEMVETWSEYFYNSIMGSFFMRMKMRHHTAATVMNEASAWRSTLQISNDQSRILQAQVGSIVKKGSNGEPDQILVDHYAMLGMDANPDRPATLQEVEEAYARQKLIFDPLLVMDGSTPYDPRPNLTKAEMAYVNWRSQQIDQSRKALQFQNRREQFHNLRKDPSVRIEGNWRELFDVLKKSDLYKSPPQAVVPEKDLPRRDERQPAYFDVLSLDIRNFGRYQDHDIVNAAKRARAAAESLPPRDRQRKLDEIDIAAAKLANQQGRMDALKEQEEWLKKNTKAATSLSQEGHGGQVFQQLKVLMNFSTP